MAMSGMCQYEYDRSPTWTESDSFYHQKCQMEHCGCSSHYTERWNKSDAKWEAITEPAKVVTEVKS